MERHVAFQSGGWPHKMSVFYSKILRYTTNKTKKYLWTNNSHNGRGCRQNEKNN
uniref:Uncharacterized protein n=1 Tax=Rhizophora mucronata TaxID=61149 RepID=A0A2P2NWX8_RHIMU